ncbi:MAG: chemotaxis protein CheW [Chitinispirillaceae bacterium]|nr:chemotaxis protein CheW [Chitinispirillaceae bacterium]
MAIQDRQMLNDLIVESKEHLSNIEPDLLELEQKGSAVSDDLINRVFRAIHSIKGGFGFFGIENVTRLSHSMENVLSKIRDKKLTVTPDLVDALLAGIDKLRTLLDDIDNSDNIKIENEIFKLSPFLDGDKSKKMEASQLSANELDIAIRKKHPDLTDEKIVEEIKNGRFIYQITLRSHADLDEKKLTPAGLFEEWEKIGKILDIMIDIDSVDKLEGATQKELIYSIVLASVLEPDLIGIALNLKMDQIYQLDTTSIKTHLTSQPSILQKQQQTDDNRDKKETIEGQKGESKIEDVLRVKVSLLNRLMNLAGELVLSRNQLLQHSNYTISKLLDTDRVFKEFERKVEQIFNRVFDLIRKNPSISKDILEEESKKIKEYFRQGFEIRLNELPGFNAIIQNIDRVTSMLQEGTMQTRLQPISVLFSKFPRIVRDLAKKCGKEINLLMEGQDVELDKSIIELLSDPLTHLIRNSVDHGIELPEKRRSCGKKETGQIVLKAYHESGKVHIKIEDDGAGIDPQKVKSKAIEKGLISASEAEKLRDDEIIKFILLPGFSTAEKVSEISGRGVGMDVVKTNIERLGGSIDISSTVGKGTAITLHLPLTLAIISSLIIEAEGRRFAIPQVGIEELVRIRSKDITKLIERIGKYEVYRLRGKLLPLVRLANVLNISPTYIDEETGERKPDRRTRWSDRRGKKEESENNVTEDKRKGVADRRQSLSNSIKIIVLRTAEDLFGLVVDEVYDSEEIVVKPLSEYLKGCGCYAGATILGDGTVTMILDPNGIAKRAELKFRDLDKAKEEELEKYRKEQKIERKDFLVFDNGSDERLAVELLSISRIEKVTIDRVENIGNKEFLRYENSAIPLVRLHNFLPIKSPITTKNVFYALIPKSNNKVGIAIENVYDVVTTEVNFDYENIKGKGVVGSKVINNRLTIVLNFADLLVDIVEN